MNGKKKGIILSINHPTMIDLAWDVGFGAKVELPVRAVFDAWLYQSLKETPTMTDLAGLVAIAIDRDFQTGKKAVRRAVDLTYLQVSEDKADKRRKLLILSPEAKENYEYVIELKRKILDVVAAQLADPENQSAGKGLVPDSIYTNVEHK